MCLNTEDQILLEIYDDYERGIPNLRRIYHRYSRAGKAKTLYSFVVRLEKEGLLDATAGAIVYEYKDLVADEIKVNRYGIDRARGLLALRGE
ncbi:hypothetical protein [Aneurinibacillus tyrosinisolvens]|uniref:hypothetical protein n=1 Tax=Aneurinibacillus tyrosinisolvens TaxID=1443435 RepID=UPI00063FA8F8|nr:hypothetical protein [Aneurinibacillus tyrosinisolvens]